jgi:hypothetical protein
VIVEIDNEGSVTIQQAEDLRAFKVVSHLQDPAAADSALGNAKAGRVDAGHAWINPQWLLKRSPNASSAEWMLRFDKMLEYARSSGYLSDQGEIRAHIDWIIGRP